MNFSCIFLLTLALFRATTEAYIAPVYPAVESVGYNGLCGGAYGAGYGMGYGAGYEGGYGCRPACATNCGTAAVCDTCQCVKTVVRPNVVERIPYACSRRLQATACRSACGLYPGGYANGGAGYMSGGYLY